VKAWYMIKRQHILLEMGLVAVLPTHVAIEGLTPATTEERTSVI
jgi:hypothetical protein